MSKISSDAPSLRDITEAELDAMSQAHDPLTWDNALLSADFLERRRNAMRAAIRALLAFREKRPPAARRVEMMDLDQMSDDEHRECGCSACLSILAARLQDSRKDGSSPKIPESNPNG